ncbi:hypothetical protein GGS26DRAFT_401364 [Hypomontagnella submonticulosa]|nr:hypothetical protein GGS26DRAFT_401364 [Hypomontagnella submonticulosa]
MGGNAFASLSTPRMSPAVYNEVHRRCRTKLLELFAIVATPIPGPAKKDHGDIDFLLAWEKSPDPLEVAARHLGAYDKHKERAKVLNIAIPWPDDLRDKDTEGDLYIQVDLHLCDTKEHLEWMLFKHAHGDFWNICGSIIRPFGLTVDDEALYIRIPEIEHLNRKEAKILLTKEPAEVLDFLGLGGPDTLWKEPFTSAEEVFEYAATCRCFWVRPERGCDLATVGGGESLKANDRHRMKSRPLFRAWVDEFLPACRQAGRFTSNTTTRDSIREDAFKRFPLVQYAYEARLLKWRNEQQRLNLFRNIIKTSIPTQQEGEEERLESVHWRSVAASAFKKIIIQDDHSLGICPLMPLRDDKGTYDEDRVKEFVKGNWKEVGDAAWEDQKRLAKRLAEKGQQKLDT